MLLALVVSLASRDFSFFLGLILENRDMDLGDGVAITVDGALDESDWEGEFESLGKRALGWNVDDEERLMGGSEVVPV